MRLGASSAHPDLSRSGRGRARSRGDLAVGAQGGARRAQGHWRAVGRRDRHHQSARDDDRVGARHRQAARQCHRVAGPAHRAALRGAERRGLGRACRRDDRARHRSLFLGDQARLAARQCARTSRAGAQRRGVLRHGRQLSPVQADRRQGSRDRSEQRRPHHALRHQVWRMGRQASRPPRHPARNSAGASRQPGRFRCDRSRAFRRGHPDQRHRRRSAGGRLRAGLLSPRHAEGDLRHRLLSARQYRRGESRLDRAHARDRVSSASKASAPSRSRDRSSWPAPRCNGFATALA